MSEMPYEELLVKVLELDRADLERLVTAVQDRLMEDTPRGESSESEPYTAEEVAEMMRPSEKLTYEELVEQGILGGWADMGIIDSVEWEQRRKRWERNS